MAYNNHGVLRRNASLVSILQRILDPLIAVAVLRLSCLALGVIYVKAYWLLAIAIIILCFPILKGVGLYHPYRIQNFRDLSIKICLGWFLILSCLLFFGFFLQVNLIFSRPALLAWSIITPLMLIGTHAVIWFALRKLRLQGHNQRFAVIAGINEGSHTLAQSLEKAAELGIQVRGFFSDRIAPENASDTLKTFPHLGNLEDLPHFVRDEKIDIVYLALPISQERTMQRVLNNLQDSTACVYYVPDILTFNLIHARAYDLGGIPLISIWEVPFSDIQSALKRAMDVVLATLILFLLSPAMLLISAAIALSSPGPIIFKQARYGLNGQRIIVYKFRSMCVQENGSNVTAAKRNDQRVTKIGAFLRKTSLDELPQFINVLQGNMSIVGPRPHAVIHNETYRKLITGYMLRHKVKPGITGWAQVNGLRGETDTLDKMQKRVEYDLAYLRDWSLWLDLKIIFQTARVFLGDSNAY